MGNFFTGEFSKWYSIHQFFLANMHRYIETTKDLPAELAYLPIFSTLFVLSAMICHFLQNFPMHSTLNVHAYIRM